jgi:hypothetical protein
MSYKYTILLFVFLGASFILNAQNYNSMTVEELTRLKDEAVKNEQFEKAAEIKKVLESKGSLNTTLSVEPYAELSISASKFLNMFFDVIIDDQYVGTVSPKGAMIHIEKIPEGRTQLKFVSVNNKHVYEKYVEIEAGKSYALTVEFYSPKAKTVGFVQKMMDDKGAIELEHKKSRLHIKFVQEKVDLPLNTASYKDLSSISYPVVGFFGATKSYFYVETTTNGFSKTNGYSYNHSFGVKQPYMRFPNSSVVWGLESNVWFSEDLFLDGSGEYSGIPTSVSINYILGLQFEITDFIIVYSTGSLGPALTETTKVTGIDPYGFATTESKWGVGLDSSADVGLILTFGPDSRAGISLETNYNSHTGNSFAIGLVFGVNKVLNRHTMY